MSVNNVEALNLMFFNSSIEISSSDVALTALAWGGFVNSSFAFTSVAEIDYLKI